MDYVKLDTNQVSAYFDDKQGIVHVIYRSVLVPDITNAVYDWMKKLFAQLDYDSSRVHGAIYDFRQVRHIELQNIVSAQQNSSQLNAQIDMRHIGVALIVGNENQREYVRLTMKITPQENRKRIVDSEELAIGFVTDYHENYLEERQSEAEDIQQK